MARGVKKQISYEAEIAKIDTRISELSDEIKTLKQQKKQLAKDKQKNDMISVYKFIKESGISAEEALEKLKK